jgi:hypothetical protein
VGSSPTTRIMEITQRDIDGLVKIEREIRNMPRDKIAYIKCFNKEEADWIENQLLNRGIDRDRFCFSWLVFKTAQHKGC